MMSRVKVVGFLLLVLSYGLPVQATSCEQHIIDKTYQRVLYYYFQQDFFTSLSLFEQLQQQCSTNWQAISQPGIDPLLLKGGMSLSYGLEEQAAVLFRQVLTQNNDGFVTTNAWFLLGKALFKKQLYSDANDALQRISQADADQYLADEDRNEWVYLRSQIHFIAGQSVTPDYQRWLATLTPDSIYLFYLQYNQALQLLRQQQLNEATGLLQSLSQRQISFVEGLLPDWFSPIRQQDPAEWQALRDRANLTLGYTWLNDQKPFKAMDAFKRVHTQSQDTDAALLGIGWAAAQQQEYQIALAAWQKLQAKPDNSEYVLEAYLASAYAYEKAFAPTQALSTLQQALSRYQQQQQVLQASLAQLEPQYFISLAQQPLKAEDMPGHLTQVLLSDGFKQKQQQLQQSLQISAQLSRWQDKLDTFQLMLDERQLETQRRAESLQQNQLLEKLQPLHDRRQTLAQSIAEAQTNPLLLAQSDELQWLERLQGALDNHASIVARKTQLDQKALSAAYQQRLQRLQGILLWQATEQQSQRLWQAQKALKQVDNELDRTSLQHRRLVARLAAKPEYAEQYARIETLQARLVTKRQDNQQLQQTLLNDLTSMFNLAVEQQLQQLANYQLQAQLALVRLNDKAYQKAQADEQQGGRRD